VRLRAADTEALLFDDVDESSSPERKVLAREELTRISDRLTTLPENCRQAFVMHVLLDRPMKEIAAEMRVTDRMVRYYISRALLACQNARDEMDGK
jgi:RNA polymerase sigma factor (sigma-70 family)